MSPSTTLMGTVRVELSPAQRRALEAIDAENFEPIKAKVKRDFAALGIDLDAGYLEEGILALKQYYAVAVLDPMNEHAVSDAIDPFWHAHVLHTEAYIAFSDAVMGRYIQHQPHDPTNARQLDELDDLYRYTMAVYAELFTYVSPFFHPDTLAPERLVCKHGPGDSASALATETAYAVRPVGTPVPVLA